MKKAHPGHDITALERNPPDATYGWGVVFSEGTLGALRDADPRSHLEITDTFARWDPLDILYRGRLLRCRGNAFSAIARTRLLDILQRRCAELGVTPRFGTAAGDPAELDTDLVVAADGVHSTVRAAAPDAFGTRVAPQGCKYAWYGTDLVLDAFRFVFAETEHGLFQAHSYPYDEHTSTFIVECPEPVWRAAGLDRMDERAGIAFCERVFAEALAGRRLLSNRSAWLDFPLVRNRSWQHGRTVLLGDAAHTAHFSIGSGTKLAMEDAIALAGAFDRHGHEVPAIGSALVDYEAERQPVVERFQRAATRSADFFARVWRHTELEPGQFAVHLLTRSGRVTHAGLAVRDAEFLREADAALYEQYSGRKTHFAPPPALVPLTVRGTRLPSRIVCPVTPVTSGAGLVMIGPVAVSPDGRTWPGRPVIEDPAIWKSGVGDLHTEGALAGIVLAHAGRRGAVQPPQVGVDVPLPVAQSWPLLSASALPYGPGMPRPKAMDTADMTRVCEAFAAAAGHALAAGFDVCELDFAHGGLVASFLSPLANHRDDEFGGSLENRLRFPLQVLAAVRAAWGDRPLVVRLSVTDWAPGGVSADEGVELARALAGADLIHVAAGQTVAADRPDYRRGFQTELSDRVRSEARVPTMVGGYLTTIDEAHTIVAAGRADLCVLALEGAL
jgi:anthraniloyl-CoA monooxygenase